MTAEDHLQRSRLLLGDAAMQRLLEAHVLVAGIGGVGSYVVEALVRAGVGELTLIDDDVIEASNINRQLHALHSTLGQYKTEAMAARCRDIQPNLICHTHQQKICAEVDASLINGQFDYIVDCVDDVRAKVALIRFAHAHHIPVISSMGTANKIDNAHFVVTDISKTTVCPLARALRKALRDQGVFEGVKVCYSPTPVFRTLTRAQGGPGTISFVPGTCGLLIAGEVVREMVHSFVF